MLRFVLLLLVLGWAPSFAWAARPDADCREWFAAGAWGAPFQAVATATLSRDVGGVFVDVEHSTDHESRASGGEFLFHAAWSAPLAAGTYRVRLEITLFANGDRFRAAREGPIFTCAASPPLFTSVPPANAIVGQAWSYDVEASNAIDFALFGAPSGMSIDRATGLIQWTPGAHQLGPRVVIVRAKNAAHACDFQAFVVDVSPRANHPPEIISEAITGARLGEVYQYDVAATDPDPGDVVTYVLLAAPAGMTIDAGSGLITWPHPELGAHPVTVRAADQLGASDVQAYAVLVLASNRPPVFVSIPETTATRLRPYLYPSHAIDPDAADVLLYSIEVAPAGMVIDPASGVVEWTPAENGTYGVTLRVEDGAGGFDEQTFAVFVSDDASNTPPLAGPDRYETNEDTALVIAGAGGVLANDFDLEQDPLRAILTTLPLHGELVLEADGAFRYVPAARYFGPDHFEYRAAELAGSGVSLPARVEILVAPINEPPSLVTSPLTWDCASGRFEYNAGAIDPDGDQGIEYSLLVAPSSGAAIDPLSGLVLFTSTVAGLHPFTIAARDPDGLSTTQTFVVEICPSTPVFVSVPPTAIEPNVPWIYPLDVLYADSVEATFILRSPAPAGLVLDRFPIFDAHLEWTPSPSQIGEHLIELDFFYFSRSGPRVLGQSFTVTVGGPGITSMPPLSGFAGVPYVYQLEVIDRGFGHQFFLSSAPWGAVIDPTTGLISWTPGMTHLGGGHHQFVVLVEDAAGIFATQAFSVLIEPGPIPPQIVTNSLGGAIAGSAYRSEIVVRDDLESALSYELVSAPSGMTIGLGNGLISWTPSFAQLGAHEVLVRVTDLDGNVAEHAYEVSVRAANRAPSIAGIAPVVVAQGETVSIALVASDADQDPLVWSLLAAPPGLVLSAGVVSFTPSSAQIGRHQVLVEVRDPAGARDVAAFDIIVGNRNDAPILAAIPHQFVAPRSELIVRASARDPDGDAIMFFIDAAPDGMTISSSGLIRFRPGFDQIGQYELIVRASDPSGAFDEAVLFLTVAGSDQPPIITSDPPSSILERTRLVYAIEAFDPDTAGSLSYSLSRAPIGASLDDEGVLAWDTTPGDHLFTVRVSSAFGAGAEQSFTLRVLDVPDAPQILSSPPASTLVGEAFEYAPVIVDLDAGDVLNVFVTEMPSGMSAAGVRFTWTPGQDDLGFHTVAFTVVDAAGLFASQSFTLEVTDINYPPSFQSTPAREAFVSEPYIYRVEVSDPNASDSVFLALVAAPPGAVLDANRVLRFTPSAADIGITQVIIRAGDGRGLIAEQAYELTTSPLPIPPDPATVAPPFDRTAFTAFVDGVSFLYSLSGRDRIQRAVAEDTIERERAAVIRGRVLDRAGQPISGVRVAILDHPEFGFTLSRLDGRFDLAVNGGSHLIVRYEAAGYVPVDRRVDVPWRDFVVAGDVVLVPLDNAATVVELSSGASIQVARATPVVDSDGARRPTLFFRPGTSAVLELGDGSNMPISTLTVRATELTVGPSGLAAMPAELPAASGYTHAVELSVDEAIAARARSVLFNNPVSYYLENFLNFPVGEKVPAGYYDRTAGAWVPLDDGRVIRVLPSAGIDIDGTGFAASPDALLALGIDTAERLTLASTYAAGQSLWRVPLVHFSPIDCNWPVRCAGVDCVEPELEEPEWDELAESPCERAGSIIDCQNQILGEDIPLTGVGAALHYRSDRVLGRTLLYALDVPVTAATMPAGVRGAELEIELAGRSFRYTFDAGPDQRHRFVWDGLDAYGRSVLGPRKANVRVGYVFDGTYAQAAGTTQSFGLPGGTGSIELRGTRRQTIVWQSPKTFFLGGMDARMFGLGGWTLTPHHVFERETGTLYLGDGSRREVRSRAGVFAGIGAPGSNGDGGPATAAAINPQAIAADARGNIYIAEGIFHRIRKITRDGLIQTIAGTGVAGFSGDGGPAIAAELNNPTGIAVDRLGNIYFTDTNNQRVRRISTFGTISTVAGSGQRGFNGHVQHAATVALIEPVGIAIGPDGELVITEGGVVSAGSFALVRKILPNGPGGSYALVLTVAGGGTISNADNVHGGHARLQYPWGVAVANNGHIYFTDTWARRVYRVMPDGMLHSVAGGGTDRDDIGDGRPAREVFLGQPTHIVVSPDGEVFFSERTFTINNPSGGYVVVERNRVRRIARDGRLSTAAGGTALVSVSGRRRGAAVLFGGVHALTFDRAGSLYVADESSYVFRLETGSAPAGELLEVPSEDGGAIYRFTPEGRHVDTLSTLTGMTLLSFDYNGDGELVRFTDPEGDETTIERSSDGLVRAIIGPDLHRTELEYDPNDYLSVARNPAGEEDKFEYSSTGLLELYINPLEREFPKMYDADGLLFRDDDPIGGFQQIERVSVPNGHRIEVTTALGRQTTYLLERLPNGDERRVMTAPSGAVSESIRRVDGSLELRAADGTITRMTHVPDPRFGMDVPIAETSVITTPNGREATVRHQRQIELRVPGDPLTLRRWIDSVTTNGRTATRTYDANTRTWTTVSAGGRTSLLVLDEYEREIESRTAAFEPIYTSYDLRGRLFARRQGDRTWTFGYDAQGFLASTTDPLLRTESYQRDPVGRVRLQTLPDLRELGFTYDANGNTTSITPPGRPPHLFTYDPLDRELDYTPPMVGNYLQPITRTYDDDGDPTSITDPDGRSLSFQYHPARGELELVSMTSSALGYIYNSSSRQLRLIADTTTFGGLEFEYDGSLITRTNISGWMQTSVDRAYDDDLRLSSTTLSGQAAISYVYDADGVLVGAGEMTLVPRAADGLLESTALGNISDSYGYNSYGELEDYQARFGNSLLYGIHELRDALGRASLRTETIAGTTRTFEYHYDNVDRLSEVWIDGQLVESYTYDPSNNRRTRVYAGVAVSADFDVQDRLTRHGDNTYTYNGLGQLGTKTVGGTATSYSYDERGNLTAAQIGATYFAYVSDPLNRRIGRVGGGSTKRWVWDGAQMIAELAANGDVTELVYGTAGHVPDFMIRGADRYRLIRDPLGSVRLVVHAETGQIAQRLDYDAFGRVLLDTNPGFQPFGFAGGHYDPVTGLVRFGARDYDPEVGRFTARDPSGFTDGTNAYVYVENDPVNAIDPTGRALNFVVGLVVGAVMDAGIDIAFQLLENGGNFSCIDWGRVGKEVAKGAAMNAVGIGLVKSAGKFAKLRKAVAACTCFAAGTLVHSADGLKAIEDISLGELVLAMNDDTGEVSWRPVLETFEVADRPLVELVLETAAGLESTLVVTPDHPFWAEKLGWVEVSELAAGVRVWSDGEGWLTMRSAAELASRGVVFNLEVAGDHSFLVGDEGVWAHNNCLGNQKTRDHIKAVAAELKNRGWDITGGGGQIKETYLRGAGPGTKGSSRVDITAQKGGRTLHINTVDTYADGITPTLREQRNAKRIRDQMERGDHLLLVPKPK